MDADRFDTIARALTTTPTRRAVLAGGLSGLLVGLLGRDDADARKGKKGKGKGKGKGKKKGGNNARLSICANGIQDGAETDVDCGGGTCPRCATGKTCASRNDCQSALCTAGTCEACSGSECGDDGDGFCFCDRPANGGPNVCNKKFSTGNPVDDCRLCPAGTTCTDAGLGSFLCYKPCGAP